MLFSFSSTFTMQEKGKEVAKEKHIVAEQNEEAISPLQMITRNIGQDLGAIKEIEKLNKIIEDKGEQKRLTLLTTPICSKNKGLQSILLNYLKQQLADGNNIYSLDDLEKIIQNENINPNAPTGYSLFQFHPSDNLLHIAAKLGNLELFELLVTKFGGNINDSNKQGVTPLLQAISNSDLRFVQWLTENEADIPEVGLTPLDWAIEITREKKDSSSQAVLQSLLNIPLFKAINTGKEEEINQVLEISKNINLQQLDGNAAMHKAVEKGNIKIVKAILEHGADLTLKNKNGQRPLQLKMSDELEKFFLEHYPSDLLFAKMFNHEYEKAKNLITDDHKNLLLNSKNKNGYTPLHFAALEGETEFMKFLIDNGAKINPQTCRSLNTPFHIACKPGNLDCVHLLIEAKNSVVSKKDSNGNSPLCYAIMADKNCKEIVDGILNSENADVNAPQDKDANTILHLALNHKKNDIAEWLISEKGAWIDIKNKLGQTPLDIKNKNDAGGESNDNLAALLAPPLRDISKQDPSFISLEKSSLFDAMHNKNIETAKELIRNRPQLIKLIDSKNKTVLHHAAKQEENFIKWLTSATERKTLITSIVDSQDNDGCTALHCAALKGNFEVIKHLTLDCTANVNIQDNDSHTAFYYAKLQKNKECIKILRDNDNSTSKLKSVFAQLFKIMKHPFLYINQKGSNIFSMLYSLRNRIPIITMIKKLCRSKTEAKDQDL